MINIAVISALVQSHLVHRWWALGLGLHKLKQKRDVIPLLGFYVQVQQGEVK